MKCQKVQLLMSLHIAGDPALTAEEGFAFEKHLQACQECARGYEESRFVIDLAKQHWSVSKDTLAFIEKVDQPTKHKITVEEGWEDMKRRIPELTHYGNGRKRLQLFRRFVAVAACFAVGVSIFLAFYYSKPEITQEPVAEQVTSAPKPSSKVVLVSENINLPIPTGNEVTTTKELKILILNDKHRIIMNTNTSLSIEPLIENSRLGCLVKLTSGEIYTHVKHDSKPFVVSTAHGKAIITGTTFDIKAVATSTMLMVVEGAVQFESEKGAVEVVTGQMSEIVGQAAPSKPTTCIVTGLTAWATDLESKDAVTCVETGTEIFDITDLPIFVVQKPIDLESIDYEQWVEEKRDWFKRQFPWIFELKDVLAREGIDVNYVDLLMQSGDIWRFAYPQASVGRQVGPDINGLLRAASHYGRDGSWLELHGFPSLQATNDSSISLGVDEQQATGLKAFKRWATLLEAQTKTCSPKVDYKVFLDFSNACLYLANTRTLAILRIQKGDEGLAPQVKNEVLHLLHEELHTLTMCMELSNGLILGRLSTNSCEYLDKLGRLIGEISKLEKQVREYEKAISK